jgi:type II secretory ATPase GspE/PulE/Tfp pilus assembly ATPase PilB-like protein
MAPAADLFSTLDLAPLTLGEFTMLVSVWKPIIPLVTLIGWMIVISKIYDKHAARFFLPRQRWNLAHLVVGLLAVAAAYAMPVKSDFAWLIGWGTMVALLALDLLAYAVFANRDERVPPEFHVKLDILTKMAANREEKKKAKNVGVAKLVVRGPDKQPVPVPDGESPEFEVRTESEKLFIAAKEARASQVDFTLAGKDGYAPSLLIDGVRQQGPVVPSPMAIKVIDFWKAAAKLDVADRRRKLTGEIDVEQGTNKTRARVTSIGVQGGMRLTLLFDPAAAANRKPNDLGLTDDQLAELKALVDEGKGLVLLAGAADNGRTTTQYSLLQLHDAYTSSIQTLEIEPQLVLEGIRHQAFDPQAEGADFGTTVRSLLRRDPDVLLVAEMPDPNTAKEVAKADFDRTRVYLGIKADNALTAVDAFLKAVGDNALAAKNLRGAVSQRLLRKLCVNCRVPYQPTPDMLKKMGVADPSKVPQLFKKGGQVLIKNKPEVCPVCQGVGFVGQEGCFEVYRFGDDDRAAIAEANLAAVKANLRKRNVRGVQQSAIDKALKGITSVEEVTRITAAPPAPAAPPKPAAPAPSA